MNTSCEPKNILVTGARAPVTLHLCRLLQSQGLQVYAADSCPYALTKVSNAVKKFLQVPSPKFETALFVQTMTKIIEDYHIDLIIPTCEETFYIAKYKEYFESYCSVLVDDIDTLNVLHNKAEFIRFTNEFGWDAPVTIETDGSFSYQEKIEQLHIKEFVLKPVYSRFSDSVRFVTKSELLSQEKPLGVGWLIQEKLDGTQYCSYTIAKNGKLLAHSVYQTEFTAGLGATIAFQHTECDPIFSFVSILVEKLKYSGQIAFDFIVTKDGKVYPIECNPRTTSGLHLFSSDIVSVFVGTNTEDVLFPNKETKMALTLALLLYGGSFLRDVKVRKRWFQVITSHRDITYLHRDKKPFFYQFYSVCKLWRESRKRNISLLQQTTYDISWDGE
ncbi:ATP-grasp domain-containing protein [Ectobacillus funiculus]|uniref:ATP-grasp domain-containing protein n=1 Tax=Ectobacillus funiculus TaxID=137993 RepID=UPI00397CBC74